MAPPGYRSQLQAELARKTRVSAGLRQVELDEHLLAAASRTSASALSISDLAQTIADEFNIRQREILKHVDRMIKHAAMKSSNPHDDLRVRNLNKRVVQLESEMRRLTKPRPI